MRVRARAMSASAGALALAVVLSGCLTVHGEEAVVPAVGEKEAAAALERFREVSNEAGRAYDTGLNATVTTGPFGAIDNARLTAQGEVDPGGGENAGPLEFSDTRFLIPQQAGWPKFFLADTDPGGGEQRWLMVFTRNALDEEWVVPFVGVLEKPDVPEFAEDEDGYLQDVPPGRDGGGSAGETDPAGGPAGPEKLSAAYADYLRTGEGPFAEGPFTSGIRAAREEAGRSPEFAMQYQDLAAEEPAYAPVAVRTADGGTLVFFGSRHHSKQTMAEGETPRVDELVEALMDGTAQRSVTLVRTAMQTALVPRGGEEITLLSRVAGVTSAQGA